MAVKPTREIKSSLLSKGFRQDNTHHKIYWLYVNDKVTSIRTRISHGVREYDDNLLAKMARQLKLKKRELIDLIDCPITGEKYLKILTEEKGVHFGK